MMGPAATHHPLQPLPQQVRRVESMGAPMCTRQTRARLTRVAVLVMVLVVAVVVRRPRLREHLGLQRLGPRHYQHPAVTVGVGLRAVVGPRMAVELQPHERPQQG